jgi:ribonuclease D
MTLPDLEPPTVVSDERGFEELMRLLRDQDEIAVDTEADSFYSYREKVCLIQVTADDKDFLIDPLADLDIAPLGEILADRRICKVFHDSEYDVLILGRDFGFTFANLFDTRVAAATLGVEAPGLASVLKEHFGVELDKSMQRSDWAKRPLSEKQIAYARLDTHFLLPLADELRHELDVRGRAMIVEGECRRLEALEPPPTTFSADEFVRIKGARALGPHERQALRELYALREQYAERADVPPFRIMNNQVLLELARERPRGTQRLLAIHGFTPRMLKRLGDDVLAALERARELGPLEQVPQLPKKDGTGGMDELELELYERLKRWRKGVADAQGIESAYLLNRHVLARIAREQPRDAKALRAIEGIQVWQLDEFTGQILKVLRDFEAAVKSGDVARRKPWRRR